MMKPRFETRPAFSIVGLKYLGANKNNQIPGLWDVFAHRSKEISHRINKEESYGVIVNMDKLSGQFDYYAGVAVAQPFEIPEGMQSIEIPAQNYAIFDCTLPTLMKTIGQVYSEWLPDSNFARTSGPEFELYDQRWHAGPDGSQEMSICIPVEKK
jgi:AraC family transcriptional regulator